MMILNVLNVSEYSNFQRETIQFFKIFFIKLHLIIFECFQVKLTGLTS